MIAPTIRIGQRVIAGRSLHGDAVTEMTPDERAIYEAMSVEELLEAEGFSTNCREHVSREEAAAIAARGITGRCLW